MSDLPALKESSLTLQNRVAELCFQRDDIRNALTGSALCDDLLATLEWVNNCNEVSVLVLTGEGAAFSAGGNIKEMRDRHGTFGGTVSEIQDNYRRGIQRMPLAMHGCEVPVIAAINGAAVGAGLDLACMCDIRIASDKARLGETFINLGIIPGDGGAWFLQRLVGYQKAAELTFTGRLINAREAQQLGLVMEVTGVDALLPRARKLAAQIAAKPPRAVRYTKRLMKLAQRQELGDFLQTCASFQAACHHTDDHLEAVNAFLEKRTPDYQGS